MQPFVRYNALLLAAAIAAPVALAPGAVAADAPLRVLATVGMVADVAHNVGGDCIEASALMGAGSDPHLYRATASDVGRFQEAGLILYVGLGFEGQLGSVLERFSDRIPTVAVGAESFDRARLIEDRDMPEGVDPHLWMSPAMWARTVPVISEAIIALRPECANGVNDRSAAFTDQLAALDAWVAQSIATIPEGQRVLVTAHDAFGYYAASYGMEIGAIQGMTTESEASIADILATAELVVTRNVPAVFVESSINPRTVEAMVEAVRDRSHEVVIGGELYSDAMGEEGTAEGTYIGMVRHNTRNIVEALGGTLAPLPAALAEWVAAWEPGQ